MNRKFLTPPSRSGYNRTSSWASSFAGINGITFYVTVTAKTEDIPADSTVGLSIATHTQNGRGLKRSIERVTPAMEVRLKEAAISPLPGADARVIFMESGIRYFSCDPSPRSARVKQIG